MIEHPWAHARLFGCLPRSLTLRVGGSFIL